MSEPTFHNPRQVAESYVGEIRISHSSPRLPRKRLALRNNDFLVASMIHGRGATLL